MQDQSEVSQKAAPEFHLPSEWVLVDLLTSLQGVFSPWRVLEHGPWCGQQMPV